jgi:hypothetical protein
MCWISSPHAVVLHLSITVAFHYGFHCKYVYISTETLKSSARSKLLSIPPPSFRKWHTSALTCGRKTVNCVREQDRQKGWCYSTYHECLALQRCTRQRLKHSARNGRRAHQQATVRPNRMQPARALLEKNILTHRTSCGRQPPCVAQTAHCKSSLATQCSEHACCCRHPRYCTQVTTRHMHMHTPRNTESP